MFFLKLVVGLLLVGNCWAEATELDFYKAQTAYLSSLLTGEKIVEQAQQRSQQVTGEAQKHMQEVCKELGGELKPNPKGQGIDCVIPEAQKGKE